MTWKRWGALVLGLLMISSPALAAETGSISGVVFDQGGQLVEGAVVTLTGAPLPGERTATTDANGVYRFPLLLPGTYEVAVAREFAPVAE